MASLHTVKCFFLEPELASEYVYVVDTGGCITFLTPTHWELDVTWRNEGKISYELCKTLQ